MKYVVVGFPKCGQESLVKYLQNQGHEAKRFDVIWLDNAVDLYKKAFSDWTPAIITRDPAERIWSGYHYWSYHKFMVFSEYLKINTYRPVIGHENPIIQSDYSRWIKPFLPFKPEFFIFEEMVKKPDFPHQNKTANKPGLSKPWRNKINEILEQNNIKNTCIV